MYRKITLTSVIALLGAGLAHGPAFAAKNYGPGVSDTEIKLGQTMPYSGPASSYGTIGRIEAAYFKMINDKGGINGRKIDLISLDDGYDPPKTVEQMRKLVEEDNVLLDFNSLGTPTNTAIQRYLNLKKVPQLFIASGATKWGNPKRFPWTMGWQPSYQTEGHIYAKYILQKFPDAKIGVLYQDDDYGKDYLKGLVDGLGAKAQSMIVKRDTYETTDPTVESQVIGLQGSGANVFYNVSIPKYAAQAIRKAYDIGWHPTQLLNNVSASVGATLKPAGLDKATGIVSTQYLKDPTDPRWQNDQKMIEFKAFLAKYDPEADPSDANNAYGYSVSETMVQVLKQCGDDLTRESVMEQAASLHDFSLPLLLPGIEVHTSATHFYPVDQEQLVRFDGKTWVPFGDLVSG
ncbi:MAG TPA: ABC transporter substrate-binding protein [Candidatus Cybelea sp.]|nr:ABC transporter substrate-binding protein [Candidatus Cybelea sp.]